MGIGRPFTPPKGTPSTCNSIVTTVESVKNVIKTINKFLNKKEK